MATTGVGRRIFIAGIGLLGCVGMYAAAVNAADIVDVEIAATINSTLAVNQGANLDFGTIDPHPLGDTITIDASTGVTTTTSTIRFSGVTAASSGSIQLISGSGMDVVLSFAGVPVSLNTNPVTTALTVSDFDVNSQGSAGAPFAHTAGTSTINIGGALKIPLAAPDGIYTGKVVVTLNYQ